MKHPNPSKQRTTDSEPLAIERGQRTDMAIDPTELLNECYVCAARCDSQRQNIYNGLGGPKSFLVCGDCFTPTRGKHNGPGAPMRADGAATVDSVNALVDATKALTAANEAAKAAPTTVDATELTPEGKSFADRLVEGLPANDREEDDDGSTFREKLAKILDKTWAPTDGK